MRHRMVRGFVLFIVLFTLGWLSVPQPTGATGRAVAEGDSAAAGKEKKKERKGLPLEPGRWLSFTAHEGTWISVDVSPDGQTIVFDLLGDLYTLPIAGGKAKRLTHGMAYDVQPRFSPDGKRVAFVSDSSGADNVWTIELESGDLKQITKGKGEAFVSPEWTPDGKYIVVSRGKGTFGPPKLWMFHVEGGSGVQLIKKPDDLKTIGAAFGKDQRYIWFARRTRDWQYNAIFPQYQLARYDRDTGETTVMTSRQGSAIRPALSPDGKFLVYGTRYDHQTGLRIRELETGEERWLAYPVQRDDQESRATLDALPGYAFTPDSKAIVVFYGGKLWRVPVDGSPAQNIPFEAEVNLGLGPEVRFRYKVEDSATFLAHQIRHPVPSPDGKRLAFTALDRLWVMMLPDGKPKRLTTASTGEFYPTWSPDGKWIAYVTWSDAEGGQILKVRSSGGKPVQLTTSPALYTETAWSPDGKRIVAIRSSARDLQEATGFFSGGLASQFVYVPAGGGSLTVIGPTEGRRAPHFTHDASRIYAYSQKEGLVSMRWDGTDVKTYVKVVGPKFPGARQPSTASLVLMAPEGDQAVAQLFNDLYTVTVPYVGGETPTVNVANPEKAPVPAKKLTEIGGRFPAWSADAKRIYWSIGNALVTYDLDAARAFADSLEQAAKADTAKADTSAAAKGKKPEKKEKPRYKPGERRIEIVARRDIPRGKLLLRGARAITMKGHEIIENADILIENNRIRAIGRHGEVEVPPDTEVRDVSGKTILPGFVDTHYHAQWLIPEVHSTQVWQYLAQLAYGVTTTRDPQTGTTDILTYEDRVETGEMVGPRIYSTGPGVFFFEQIKSQEHARKVLKRYSDYYHTNMFKMYMSGNRQQRQWLIIAARELRLMPTTEGGLDFKLNLTHAIDGYSGLEHALPIYPLYDDVLKLFVKSGITYTPTLLVSYGGPFAENYYYTTENVYGDTKLRRFTPYKELAAKTLRRGSRPGPGGWFHRDEYIFDKHAQFLARLIPAGGRAGVGSHGQLQGLGYHWELWSVQSGGLSQHDALRMATIYGAEAIGMGDDLGSLEPGKLADLIVLRENPLEDIRNTNTIRYVMKNGRLYDGDTLDEVWPRKRALPEPYWRNSAPHVAAGIK